MNRVILSGNLTRDPEVRYTQSGKAYARIGIAVTRPYSKDKEKATDFFTFVAWEKTAEFCGNYLKKGSRIIAEGRLQMNSYEKDGVRVNTVDIVVENIEFGDTKRQSDGDDDNNYSSRKSSGNDYQKSNYSNRREQAPPKRKNNYDDDFGGEPIDPEDTPF